MNLKRKMKVSFFFAVFMLSIFSIVSISSPSTAKVETVTAVKNVAIVFSTGGLGDKSFNDAGFEGAKRANDTSVVNIDYVEPENVDEINNFIAQFAASSDPVYDLIIAIGFSSADGVNASSLANTDKNYAIIDMVVDNPNVANIVFKEHEGSFLAGALAAMVTESDILGFLGGLDIPLINKFRSGYEQGARYINPEISVLSQYSPDATNPWGDIAGGKTVANQFISQGADIIYAAAGGTGLGVFDAAEDAAAEGKTVYGIGVDSNQDYINPGYVLTSMIKRVDVAVENLINSIVDGTFAAGFTSLGLEQDGVGITDMEFTTDEKDTLCGDKTRFTIVGDLKAEIIAGTITVDDERQAEADYNTVAHPCGKVVVDTDDTSSDDTSDETTSTPGFEASLLFLGLLVVPIIRRKLKK